MARELKWATKDYVPGLLNDSSAQVVRELAIALREDRSAEMPGYWTTLAARYDGKDRWLLEALGIGAMDRWMNASRLGCLKWKASSIKKPIGTSFGAAVQGCCSSCRKATAVA